MKKVVKFNKKIFGLILVFSLFWEGFVIGISSQNYQIPWDSLNAGGGEGLSSQNYNLESTIGQSAIGE